MKYISPESDMTRIRPKVAVAHPQFARGGSDAAAVRIVEALKADYEITVITGYLGDLSALNCFYGTALSASDFSIRLVPQPRILRRTPRWAALRGCLYQRFCQRVAREYDLLINTYNICDVGMKAIQCIADLSFDEELRRMFFPLPPGPLQRFYRNGILRRVYLAVCRSVTKSSGRSPLRDDVIVANSKWTARIIQERYGGSPYVVYPPVEDQFPLIPMRNREIGFVCVGVVAPHKRIEDIIRILLRVRQAGHDVHLHIIGQIGDDTYGRMIQRLCQENCQWIIVEGQLHGQAKKSMLASHRYGIHACRCEAFGIAVAEMVKAGCIPFIPCEGGQAEIVDHEALMYSSVEDAVVKIDALLRDTSLQESVQSHLASQARLFGTNVFQQGIRDVVSHVIAAEKSVHGCRG